MIFEGKLFFFGGQVDLHNISTDFAEIRLSICGKRIIVNQLSTLSTLFTGKYRDIGHLGCGKVTVLFLGKVCYDEVQDSEYRHFDL